MFASSGSTGGRSGDAKTIISPNTSFVHIIIMDVLECPHDVHVHLFCLDLEVHKFKPFLLLVRFHVSTYHRQVLLHTPISHRIITWIMVRVFCWNVIHAFQNGLDPFPRLGGGGGGVSTSCCGQVLLCRSH